MILTALSWAAVAILSVSYWFQIWKIHQHREVRDLSVAYHWLFFCGTAFLGVQAYLEHSAIFLIKQITTAVPVAVLLCQIYYHKKDCWHDAKFENCAGCGKELEPAWGWCPYCGWLDTGCGD